MIEYDDGMVLLDGDRKSQEVTNSSSTYSLPMEYENRVVSEDVLLNCPHCHKTLVYTTTSRFPTMAMGGKPLKPPPSSSSSSTRAVSLGFFNFNRSSSANHNYKTLEGLFPFPFPITGGGGGTTLWNKKCRWCCGFLVVLLTTFLLFSYLLQSQSDKINRMTQSGGMEEVENESQVKIKRLPQCIIIGARKCGTRALIDMLNLHPQVEKAALEVHFFDRDDNYGKGLEWYRAHMPETTEDQLSIEKSPSYFVTPEVPERVQGMNSSIKLFLIVREPVTRVISDYTQIYGTTSKLHNVSRSPRLEELVLHGDGAVNVHYKAVRISLYSRYLQRWFDVFPPNQIHVIDGDALIKDPYSELREAERFLGLPPRLQRDNFYFNVTKGFYCWRKLGEIYNDTTATSTNDVSLHCLNDSKGRPHPQVEPQIVSKLRRFYHPHNLRFYDMVGRDFGWPEK